MKRLWAFLLVLLQIAMGQSAFADSSWLIADSDTRLLTEEELWQWDYESLCYIEQEIYARHGYRFHADSPYNEYFSTKDWYVPTELSNVDGCYAHMSETEWNNVYLILQVQCDMLKQGSLNLDGKSIWNPEPSAAALVFEHTAFRRGQTMPVFAAPSTSAWRGANGKSEVSTNGDVWVAGWDGDWLLIYYETSGGSVRVGYINKGKFKDDMSHLPVLEFAKTEAKIQEACTLTDDITQHKSTIAKLKAGTQVVYLAPYYAEDGMWAYIETRADGKVVRGVVPMACIDLTVD